MTIQFLAIDKDRRYRRNIAYVFLTAVLGVTMASRLDRRRKRANKR